jgi:hypothetical protein
MEMTERRPHTEFWVVFGILVALFLATQVPRSGPLALGGRRADSNVVSVFGGARRVPEGPFQGAKVTSFMGSSVLDLRNTTLAGGEEATIDLLAVMGSVVLRVPDGWFVDTRAVPVVGGMTDLRGRHGRSAEREDGDGDGEAAAGRPHLVLHGAILLGGLRITS